MLYSDIQQAKNLSNQLKGLGYKPKVVVKQPRKISNLDFLKGLRVPAKKTFKSYKKPTLSPYKIVEKDIPDANVLKSQEAAKTAIKAAAMAADAVSSIEDFVRDIKDSESLSKTLVSSVLNAKVSIERTLEEAKEASKKETEPAVQAPVTMELTNDMITQDTARHIVKLMHELPEKDKLEVSQGIRNAQSFIFNNKRYKIEELMHGGGSSGNNTTTNIITQYSLVGVQAGSDVTVALSQLTHFATLIGVVVAYRNQIPQTQGVTCNITATDITFFGADASEVFSVTYTYA